MRDPRTKRFARLIPGLVLFGVAIALGVEAELGVNPWTVFHGGVAEQTGLSIGTVVVITGLALLTLFAPLREPLGLGTIGNALIIGPSIDVTLAVIPDVTAMWVRVALMLISPAVLGIASGMYIGAGLGPGPRDGLMTALERRGMRVGRARTIIEMTALAIGWLLGGDVGIGTVWFAVSVGWFVQRSLPPFRIDG